MCFFRETDAASNYLLCFRFLFYTNKYLNKHTQALLMGRGGRIGTAPPPPGRRRLAGGGAFKEGERADMSCLSGLRHFRGAATASASEPFLAGAPVRGGAAAPKGPPRGHGKHFNKVFLLDITLK